MTHNQRSGVARGYTQSYLGRRRLFRFQAEALRRLLGTTDLSSLPDMKGLRKLARSEADSAVLRQAGNAPIQVCQISALYELLVTFCIGPVVGQQLCGLCLYTSRVRF